MDPHGLGEHGIWVEAEMLKDHEAHERAAQEQQAGLHDLHPGGRLHAAERDIDDHQHADDDDGVDVVETEEQLDQLAGADHLRDQIEGDGDERAGGRQRADARLVETERGDVGKRVATEIAQALGDEKEHDRPADEKTDRIDQPVVAARVDERGDAEEGGCRHEVAGDRQPVLQPRDTAARGIEIGSRSRAPRRPIGDGERQKREDDEHGDRCRVQSLLLDGPVDCTGSRRGRRRREDGECRESWSETADHRLSSSVNARAIAS